MSSAALAQRAVVLTGAEQPVISFGYLTLPIFYLAVAMAVVVYD
jgi:hypothetical protein